MPKSTINYWNPLLAINHKKWEVIEGTNELIEQLTLSQDQKTGDYTRLTRFKPGANTHSFGPQCHTYPEEILIIKGKIFDKAFNQWLETGEYASRPPGEIHGPFHTDVECIVLEVSYPSQTDLD